MRQSCLIALLSTALFFLRVTNAQSTVTISINTAVCPVDTGLPPITISPIVIVYPTTVSGSIISVTSTSYDTITESRTLGPSGGGISTTPTAGVPATSAVSSASPTNSPCPASLFMLYDSTAGVSYELLCTTDFLYNDLPSVSTSNFSACIDACDRYVPTPPGQFGDLPCVAVTFVGLNPNGNNCYLKSSINQVVYGDLTTFSAKQASYNPVIGSVAVSVIQSTTFTPTTLVPSGPLPVSASSNTPSPSSPSSFQPASPCPLQNNTVVSVDTSGKQYTVLCSVDFSYDDLITTLAYTFNACIEACNAYAPQAAIANNQPCIAVTYVGYNPNGNGGNCYLKFGIYSVTYGNSADSALLLGQNGNACKYPM